MLRCAANPHVSVRRYVAGSVLVQSGNSTSTRQPRTENSARFGCRKASNGKPTGRAPPSRSARCRPRADLQPIGCIRTRRRPTADWLHPDHAPTQHRLLLAVGVRNQRGCGGGHPGCGGIRTWRRPTADWLHPDHAPTQHRLAASGPCADPAPIASSGWCS